MAGLPSGTVTFLFTDIEGSTTRWEHQPSAMATALARHDALIRAAISEHGGYVVKTMGDAFHAAFSRAPDAVAAALAAQRQLQAEAWGELGPLRVRMALHTGAAEERDGDYYGPAVNRAARLAGIGHGGQVLLSQATYHLVRDTPPEGASLLDLGEHRLKDLVRPERIYQLVAPNLKASFSPLPALDARPNNLPTHPTALLGRERQVTEIVALLRDDARLVTLTGPGGTGKTRLSLQVAADLLEGFEHGTFLVELASLSDPTLVPDVIAQALGVRDMGGRSMLDGLRDHLRRRTLLLVLDNFEQILPAASVVSDLLTTSPGLKVLVTSREPLRLRGEREYNVPPLGLPDGRQAPPKEVLAGYPAVALFVERAVAINPDFAMTNENAAAVAEVCTRLDGLPLAIELAAARIRLLSPQAMLTRLDRRLPLLTGGARDLPARQQTLRGSIDWSYDLLCEDERRVFRRLAVFVGAWTLEAAEVVCEPGGPDTEVLSRLESLAARSLIQRVGGADPKSRFRMLETIREYALERLEESDEATPMRRRHAEYYLAVAERAEPELQSAKQIAWIDCLEAEHGNMRASLQFIVEEDEVEMALRLGKALSHFWDIRGYHTEGRAHLTRLVRLTGARAYPDLLANAIDALGSLILEQGDQAGARSCYEESLAIMRELGDRRGVARSLLGLGWVANDTGDFSIGRAMHEESLSTMRELGDRQGIALALNGLGYVAAVLGDHVASRAYHEENLAIMRELGDARNVARTLAHLGEVAIDQRDQSRARELLAESLAIARELGDPRVVVDGLETSAHLALAVGGMDRAARLHGAAEALRETIGVPLSPSERAHFADDVTAVRAALDDLAFASAWTEGRSMSPEEATDYALEESNST